MFRVELILSSLIFIFLVLNISASQRNSAEMWNFIDELSRLLAVFMKVSKLNKDSIQYRFAEIAMNGDKNVTVREISPYRGFLFCLRVSGRAFAIDIRKLISRNGRKKCAKLKVWEREREREREERRGCREIEEKKLQICAFTRQ